MRCALAAAWPWGYLKWTAMAAIAGGIFAAILHVA